MDSQQDNPGLMAIKLDAERRREIDDIRNRMDSFLRAQIEVTNELKAVSKGQDLLKERFEMGVSATLKEMKGSFDDFKIQWANKLSDDKQRDEKISEAKTKAEEAEKKSETAVNKFNSIVMNFAYVIIGGVVFTGLLWGFSVILKRGG